MYVGTEFIKTAHYRKSKKGVIHAYLRKKTMVIFRCDACQEVFSRERGKMNPKRLNNNFYHVCSNCDAKKFAQSKGVEARKVWDMPVSSLKTLGQL